MNKKILLTGANGQLGTVLKEKLNQEYGVSNVIISDINNPVNSTNLFVELNVLDKAAISEVLKKFEITEIYHLAAILSAKAEEHPILSWNVNFNGVLNVFESAHQLSNNIKIFNPSSIAVFGDTTPKMFTPQDVPLLPTSNYGMAKVAGELWSNYYYLKYKLDIRSLRFPGIISYQSPPGGGTTDYAIEMYHAAAKTENYSSYIDKDTRLPMMYIDDAMRAIIELMESSPSEIKCRSSYNLAGVSFTPHELHQSILQHEPSFKVQYNPDYRESIAKSWSESIDDTTAKNDWGWEMKYDLGMMTKTMLNNLKV